MSVLTVYLYFCNTQSENLSLNTGHILEVLCICGGKIILCFFELPIIVLCCSLQYKIHFKEYLRTHAFHLIFKLTIDGPNLRLTFSIFFFKKKTLEIAVLKKKLNCYM